MFKYLLDTNIVIYVIKKRPIEVMGVFNQNANRMAISAITFSELQHGAEKSVRVQENLNAIEEFTTLIDILPYTAKASMHYGDIRAVLEKAGKLDNTVVIYTSDNGWQMPRGLANCYDSGSRVPLAIRWGKNLAAGRKVDAFVNVADLGPTFLELAGLTPPSVMSMHSIKNLMLGKSDVFQRDAVFIERERHANVRKDNWSYPIRAVRTRDFLYLRNLRPDRWPAGDPDVLFLHGRPYGDVDTTGVKDFLLAHQNDPAYAKNMALIFGKRPAEEFYDLRSDPHQLINVADKPEYQETIQQHRRRVDEWMKETHDPRLDPSYDGWDKFSYYGKAPRRN